MEGVFEDNFTSGDQEIPEWPVKITFPGEAKTAITLGIKFWFVEVGLSTSDSILGLLLIFWQNEWMNETAHWDLVSLAYFRQIISLLFRKQHWNGLKDTI